MDNIGFHILENTIVLAGHGKRREISKTSKEYSEVLELIQANNTSGLHKYLDPNMKLKATSGLRFYIDKGNLYFEGEKVEHRLVEVILSRAKSNDVPYTYLVEFLIRLMRNQSANSRDQLYDFVENNGLSITNDGLIVGYKTVNRRSDGRMFDIHSGRVEYIVGHYVQMDRNDVVDDRDRACGPGLHFGTWDYAKGFGGPESVMLEVLVDPADVVSVPVDCGSQKCRVCRMFISAVIDKNKRPEETKTKTVVTKTAKTKPKRSQKQTETVRIGNRDYNFAEVPADYIETHKTFKKLVPSDVPKFFKDLRCDVVYRERRMLFGVKTFNYVALRDGIWVRYSCKLKNKKR